MPPIFTVGWVCALPDELAAARVVMDERYEPVPSSSTDTNVYRFGRIGVHDVVAACLPAGQIGTNSAAVVASHMRNSFPSLRFVLLVGIGGGVPSDEHDIRLGDVVISQPAARHGGVVQFDFGKTVSGGEFTRTGSLNAPPTILLSALSNLRTDISLDEVHTMEYLSAFANHRKFTFPGSSQDVLYSATSEHVSGPTCASCRKEDIIVRPVRNRPDPVLFFGTIASGNQVMKDGSTRDRISQDLGGVLCFEMEAAGLMNNFECLVVRGICDYADAHKNKQWQPYAAAAAAACAKDLLLLVPQVVSGTGNSQIAHRPLATCSAVSSLSDEDKDCLRSLAFPEQESRGQEIHFAQNTCQWLLMDYQYWEWTKKTSGLFWVKGSPGTGKSALMKFAATAMRSKQPGDLVLSYFIHGRGTDLQRSLLGVFRALLNTMLASFPQYLSQLTKMFEDREARYGSYQERRWSWAAQELQDCMLKTLSQGTEDKPVIIFIDALDECGEHDAKALLSYFRVLMQQIEMGRGKVRICFSSRHYPILGSDTIPTVFVERQNGEDIRLVVHERLKQIAPGNRRQQIEAHILSKSQGGFQWAVLVTDTILDGDATGSKETNLLKMLTSIPKTLDGLYGDILSRCTGAKKEQMVKLFQWILFARRPLSSQELREALATDKDRVAETVDLLRRHDSWVENLSQFEKHVKHLSRGLVEFRDRDVWEQYEPDGELWNREAQFIHQSVADYLVEKFLSRDDEDRNTTRSVVGAGHLEISRSCLRYITISDMEAGACLPRGSLSVRFPLAPYTVQSLFHHVRKVEHEGLPQLDLLSVIQWDRRPKSLQQIADLWNVLDPDYAHAPKGWPFIGATPLHVSIAFGSQSAFDAILEVEPPDIDAKDTQGNTPLLLAIKECHLEMAFMLLDRSFTWSHRQTMAVHENANQNQLINHQGRFSVDVNATNDEGDYPLSVALTTTNAGDLIYRLIKAGADVNLPRKKAELFVYAIRNMDSALFMNLITEYAAPDGVIYFVFQEISHGNKCHILEVFLSELLKAGANTSRSWAFDGFSNTNNTDGHYSDGSHVEDSDEDEEVILAASRLGQTPIIKLLLLHNISPNCSNIAGDTPLLLALRRRHLETVELLLVNGANPNITTKEFGETPLCLAVADGHPELIRILLDQGADPNITTTSGETPLHLAMYRHMEIVELLLLKDANPNITNKDSGETPLHLATVHGFLEKTELLLAKGANPNIPNKDSGETPLHLATVHGHLKITELLLAKNAIPNIANKEGETPLRLAVAYERPDIIKLLLANGSSPNIPDKKGKTPLHSAVGYKNPEIVELLLANGVTPDITNEKGETPLRLAIAHGHSGIIELLLANGSNPNIPDNNGKTPFHSAVRRGNFEIIKLLLAKGSNPNTPADNGKTPFHSAVSYGNLEMTELLLTNGADPEITDNKGRSSLYFAVAYNNLDIVRLLLARGACQNSVFQYCYTLLDRALSNGNISIASLFLQRTSLYTADDKGGLLLYLASTGKYPDIVDVLLQEENIDPDVMSRNGQTALGMAATGGHFEAARRLLEIGGANPNIACRNGRVPLNSASAGGHLEVVRLLLQNGACLYTLDDDGRTPLYNALRGGHLEIARLLLRQGANPDNTSNQGLAPSNIASLRQFAEIAELLLEESAKWPAF